MLSTWGMLSWLCNIYIRIAGQIRPARRHRRNY